MGEPHSYSKQNLHGSCSSLLSLQRHRKCNSKIKSLGLTCCQSSWSFIGLYHGHLWPIVMWNLQPSVVWLSITVFKFTHGIARTFFYKVKKKHFLSASFRLLYITLYLTFSTKFECNSRAYYFWDKAFLFLSTDGLIWRNTNPDRAQVDETSRPQFLTKHWKTCPF